VVRSKVILLMKSVSFRRASQAGFTLLEIIVVLGVIGALLAALSPLAFSFIDDARETQAQNDVNQIATAIGSFLKSTGVPPYKNVNNAEKIPKKETADYFCLYSSSGTVFSADTDSTTGDSWSKCWSAVAGDRDTLENHLIKNTPGGQSGNYVYRTTGRNKWEGPYLPLINSDPWGNQYLANIGQMDPSAATPLAAWVISAGPNGLLETAFAQNAAASIAASGDDLIARVK
jgi:prepilin-type N-terminal cleavage/methylation domain-containing protein